jgi:hypothetical protein
VAANKITLTDHGISLKPMDSDSHLAQQEVEDDGNISPEAVRWMIRNAEGLVEPFWKNWINNSLSHIKFGDCDPVPMLDYGIVEREGVEFPVVREHTIETHNNSRPLLKMDQGFRQQATRIGKAMSLQHAVYPGKRTHEVADEVPYKFFPYEIKRVREFIEENGTCWICFDQGGEHNRIPINFEQGLQGCLYVMYTLDRDEVVPRYIGINSISTDDHESLGWGFRNMEKDSVMGRWGYQKGQHLGSLSRSVLDYYDESKGKYDRWADALFWDGRVLNEPIYVEMIPWYTDDLHISEQNMVYMASELYPDRLLNIEYADEDRVQQARIDCDESDLAQEVVEGIMGERIDTDEISADVKFEIQA